MGLVRSAISFRGARGFSGRPWRVQNVTNKPWQSGGGGTGVLYGIIGVNVAVFVAWNSASGYREREFMVRNFTMSKHGVLKEGRVHTLLTHMFSHKDMWHLASNMISLYFFGAEALVFLGSARFLVLYMGGGIVSAGASFFAPSIIKKLRGVDGFDRFLYGSQHSPYSTSLGASGAVSAVVIWGILLSPFRTIMIFPLPLPLPSWLVGMAFVGQDLYGAAYRPHSNTGHSAHLGGAAWGAAYFLMRRGR